MRAVARCLQRVARAVLTWNGFRTLASIEPSYWLRQLHTRMFGFDERYRVPASLDVRLWESATFSSAGEARTDTVDVELSTPPPVSPAIGAASWEWSPRARARHPLGARLLRRYAAERRGGRSRGVVPDAG